MTRLNARTEMGNFLYTASSQALNMFSWSSDSLREDMNKKTVFVAVIMLLAITMSASPFGVQPAEAAPKTWYVDDDGGVDFTSIESAISAGNSGDTIFVYNGTYYEHLVITKQLTLIGESKYGAIIDGSKYGPVIRIRYTTATLRNFTVHNGGWGSSWLANCAFYLDGATSCDVSDNVIADCRCGVFLDPSSTGNTVSYNIVSDTEFGIGSDRSYHANSRIIGNSISNCSTGIYFNSPVNLQIVGNTISNMTGEVRYGIHFQTGGYNNTVIGNTVMGYCSYAVAIRYADENQVVGNVLMDSFYGIELGEASRLNNVSGNIAIGNGVGIRIAEGSNDNLVSLNTFSDSMVVGFYISDIGIWVDSSDRNVIHDNEIINNGCGLLLSSSDNTTVYHNSFVDNVAQALVSDSLGNSWDDGYPSGGNYWSDYNGVDANDDIIGDTPYVIDMDNVDNYPFICSRRTHPCDINGDGRVDIADVAVVCCAFGSWPTHERWNPTCDVNGDSRIGIMDVALACHKFGWHRPL